jgi:hypothetical protein
MAKKKLGKHLQFYFDCIHYGLMPTTGLCKAAEEGLISKSFLDKYYNPDKYDKKILFNEGKDTAYWGSDDWGFCLYKFTYLRQTIVLFMACLNNEL